VAVESRRWGVAGSRVATSKKKEKQRSKPDVPNAMHAQTGARDDPNQAAESRTRRRGGDEQRRSQEVRGAVAERAVGVNDWAGLRLSGCKGPKESTVQRWRMHCTRAGRGGEAAAVQGGEP
jgi:hypothetical protein